MFEDDTAEMTVFEMFEEEDDMLEDGDTSEDNGYHNAHSSVEDPDWHPQLCTFLGAKQNFTSPNDPTWYAIING